MRENLEAVERMGGGRDKLLDAVKIPPGFEYLWALFCELRHGASQGFAGAALTWTDIEAYERLTGTRLDGFELEAVMAMDVAVRG